MCIRDRFIDQQTEAEQKKAQAERKKTAMTEQLKKAAERQQKLEAKIGEEMMEWLERHRLLRHAKAFIEVAGTCVPLLRSLPPRAFAADTAGFRQGRGAERPAVPDGREHRRDRCAIGKDVVATQPSQVCMSTGSAMTHIEKMRLQAALKTTSGA